MALYEIDTLKSSLKKYAVVLTIGLGAGVYLSNCAFKPNRPESVGRQTPVEYNANYAQQQSVQYRPRELTREELRLKTFETYTRP